MKTVIILTLTFLFALSVTFVCMAVDLPPEWLFDDQDDIKNWGAMNQLAPLKIKAVKDEKGNTRTVLITESTGGDPFVFPDGGWQGFNNAVQQPFDGKKYSIFYMGVRVNVAGAWQIYYVTEDDATYSERQRQNIQVDSVDVFKDFEFKMQEGGWNQKTITGFRLDPGTVAGVIAEIDYISLRGIPEDLKPKAVNQSGKLAVSWGEIKK